MRLKIIIDEVQRVPSLLSVVHKLIEEHRGWQFILTGSSSRKFKREGVDLFAGRAIKRTLHPFMAAELGAQFSLSDALQFGMLPLRLERKDPEAVLHAYIDLYLQEEVKAEGLVRRLEDFSRFLEALTFSHGSVLNIQNIAQECNVKRKTVHNYLSIVEDLLIGYQLQVFTKRAKRALSVHPKFYFFDAGVFRTLRPKSILDIPEEIGGATLEGIVAQHLWAWKDYTREKHELFFWRTRAGAEVDFIVYGPWGIWAIEVKNGKNVTTGDLRGLESFLEDYPMAKAFLLYQGQEPLKIKNVTCVPCDTFFRSLMPNQPIEPLRQLGMIS